MVCRPKEIINPPIDSAATLDLGVFNLKNMENTCKKCGETKDVSLFVKNKKCLKGVTNLCLNCVNNKPKNLNYLKEYKRKYYLENKNKIKEKSKIYYLENSESIKKNVENYTKENIEKIAISRRNSYYKNRDERLEKRKKWYEENKEYSKDKIRKRNKINIDKLNCVYIKKRLKDKGFTKEQITPELIEVQKIIIKTKRLCKTSQI